MKDLFYGLGSVIMLGLLIVSLQGPSGDVYKKALGEEIVIKHDTLVIVDFSIINNSFTLSNGVVIHEKLYHEIKSKKIE